MPYIVQLGFFGGFVPSWGSHLLFYADDAKRFNTYEEAMQGRIDVYLSGQDPAKDEPFWRKTDNIWRVIEVKG